LGFGRKKRKLEGLGKLKISLFDVFGFCKN
jgi:hypothetical protein